VSRHRHQLVIVGAGPGGLAAAAHAHAEGVSYVLLERTDHLADTIFCYQARKHVMAEPGNVPLRSELEFELGSREQILGSWQDHVEQQGLNVHFKQDLTSLKKEGATFLLKTAAGDEYETDSVVLAIGTQGSPRTMDVPGEDLPHVLPRLGDPDEYEDKDILVVGAGDSALEIALALAEQNRVGLVVRKPTIERAKEVLAEQIRKLDAAGRMKVHYRANPKEVREGEAVLFTPEKEYSVPADFIFVKIGATAPRKFLEGCGIEFTGPGREALPKISSTYETSVAGLYLIGATSGQDLIKLAINQGYEVVEHILGHAIDPADEDLVCENLHLWQGKAVERIAQLQDEIPLFGKADELSLREMFRSVTVRSYRDGETILRQNDSTQTLVVIAAGQVAISVRQEGGGKEREVAALSAGNFFGEMGLISGRRRNATATARGRADIIEIPRKAMLKLLRSCPPVKEELDRTFLIRAFRQYLFPDASADLLLKLARRAETVNVDRDHVLFAEGDPGDAFYLIRSGMVKISKQSGDREVVVSYLEAGNSFGETALLEGVRRTASVATIFPSELIRMSKEDCDAVLVEYPEERDALVARLEGSRIDNLILDATPGAGRVAHDLIRHEVVMGTDALIIDNHKCVRCNNCVHACESVHDDHQARLSLTGIEFYNLLAPNSCWQCIDPKCMLECPPDAIVRNPRGEVFIKSNCIGCGNCERNCPYDNIFMVYPKAWYERLGVLGGFLGRIFAGGEKVKQQVAVKCDLCASLSGGPACVRSCPTGAAIRLDPQTYQQTLEELVVQGRGT